MAEQVEATQIDQEKLRGWRKTENWTQVPSWELLIEVFYLKDFWSLTFFHGVSQN